MQNAVGAPTGENDPIYALPLVEVPSRYKGVFLTIEAPECKLFHFETVMKRSHTGAKQQRLLIITDMQIYLAMPDRSVKRWLSFTDIAALQVAADSQTVCFKVPGEYDLVITPREADPIRGILQRISQVNLHRPLRVDVMSEKTMISGANLIKPKDWEERASERARDFISPDPSDLYPSKLLQHQMQESMNEVLMDEKNQWEWIMAEFKGHNKPSIFGKMIGSGTATKPVDRATPLQHLPDVSPTKPASVPFRPAPIPFPSPLLNPTASLHHPPKAALSPADVDESSSANSSVEHSPSRAVRVVSDPSFDPAWIPDPEYPDNLPSMPIQRCAQGHILELTHVPLDCDGEAYANQMYFCGVCLEQFSATTHATLHCAACEEDFCPACTALRLTSTNQKLAAELLSNQRARDEEALARMNQAIRRRREEAQLYAQQSAKAVADLAAADAFVRSERAKATAIADAVSNYDYAAIPPPRPINIQTLPPRPPPPLSPIASKTDKVIQLSTWMSKPGATQPGGAVVNESLSPRFNPVGTPSPSASYQPVLLEDSPTANVLDPLALQQLVLGLQKELRAQQELTEELRLQQHQQQHQQRKSVVGSVDNSAILIELKEQLQAQREITERLQVQQTALAAALAAEQKLVLQQQLQMQQQRTSKVVNVSGARPPNGAQQRGRSISDAEWGNVMAAVADDNPHASTASISNATGPGDALLPDSVWKEIMSTRTPEQSPALASRRGRNLPDGRVVSSPQSSGISDRSSENSRSNHSLRSLSNDTHLKYNSPPIVDFDLATSIRPSPEFRDSANGLSYDDSPVPAPDFLTSRWRMRLGQPNVHPALRTEPADGWR